MQGDAIQLRQTVDGSPKTVARQRTYVANVIRSAIALFLPRPRTHSDEHADGLDALDMLGGWQGSGRKRHKPWQGG